MKVQILVLIKALVHQRRCLVLTLKKQRQNIASAYIIMVIIVICLLMEKKSLSFKPTMTTSAFQFGFA